MKVNVKT